MKKPFLKLIAFCAAMAALACQAAEELHFRTDINPGLIYFQAYQNMPQFSEEDSSYLFDYPTGGVWPEKPFDEKALGLLKQWDNSFKAIHRARFSKVPCDWGYDLTDGAEALLPGLAPAKRLAQITKLRVKAALDANQFDSARQDIAAEYALGRNLSKDGILISFMVQVAIENILTSLISENYYRLSADQLDQLVADFDSAPPRGTIADTLAIEKSSFYGNLLKKTRIMIAESKGNNEQFWSRFEPYWNNIATEHDSKTPDPSAEVIKKAAENEAAHVTQLLDEMPVFYAETGRFMRLPYADYKKQSPELWAKIDASKNPFIKHFFTLFPNLRGREFMAQVRQEMVRAAAAYKRGGMQGLQMVKNPLDGQTFEFSREIYEGVDRGFRLTSREHFRDFPEVMVFLEKTGSQFRLDGKNVGTPRPAIGQK